MRSLAGVVLEQSYIAQMSDNVKTLSSFATGLYLLYNGDIFICGIVFLHIK